MIIYSFIAKLGDPGRPKGARTVLVYKCGEYIAYESKRDGWCVIPFPRVPSVCWRCASEGMAVDFIVDMAGA